MAEGRNQFVYGWRAVGLVFIFFASYYRVVEGFSASSAVESFALEYVQVEEGETSVLPCKINTNVDVVYWHTWGGLADLVYLDLSDTPPLRSGGGYDAGLFNITDDFSLVMNNVQPEDENLYHCFMWDQERSVLYQNTTLVFVNKKGLPMISTDASTWSTTETTPEMKCPSDDVFKVTFGVSVSALVFSWVLIPSCLLWKDRRAAVKRSKKSGRRNDYVSLHVPPPPS